MTQLEYNFNNNTRTFRSLDLHQTVQSMYTYMYMYELASIEQHWVHPDRTIVYMYGIYLSVTVGTSVVLEKLSILVDLFCIPFSILKQAFMYL